MMRRGWRLTGMVLGEALRQRAGWVLLVLVLFVMLSLAALRWVNFGADEAVFLVRVGAALVWLAGAAAAIVLPIAIRFSAAQSTLETLVAVRSVSRLAWMLAQFVACAVLLAWFVALVTGGAFGVVTILGHPGLASELAAAALRSLPEWLAIAALSNAMGRMLDSAALAGLAMALLLGATFLLDVLPAGHLRFSLGVLLPHFSAALAGAGVLALLAQTAAYLGVAAAVEQWRRN